VVRQVAPVAESCAMGFQSEQAKSSFSGVENQKERMNAPRIFLPFKSLEDGTCENLYLLPR
jgi:hypothetical protein